VYGGIELVVDHLSRGCERAGHAVKLFTTGDSTCQVERHSVLPEAVGTTECMVDDHLTLYIRLLRRSRHVGDEASLDTGPGSGSGGSPILQESA
jgi:hypothetical protein